MQDTIHLRESVKNGSGGTHAFGVRIFYSISLHVIFPRPPKKKTRQKIGATNSPNPNLITLVYLPTKKVYRIKLIHPPHLLKTVPTLPRMVEMHPPANKKIDSHPFRC